MNLIPLNIDNVQQATDYLASIGKLQEFNEKKIEASQWSAVILILESNNDKRVLSAKPIKSDLGVKRTSASS